jgi:hypothetical protein
MLLPCGCTRSSTALSRPTSQGDALEAYVRREDAERFIEEVRREDPELAVDRRIEERELQTGTLN